MLGLLRTSDYETLVAALSLMACLLRVGRLGVLGKVKLAALLLKVLGKNEIEFSIHIQ